MTLNLFVGGEAMVTLNAFAAAADGCSLAGRARVDHFVILTTAFRTSHSVSALPVVASVFYHTNYCGVKEL